MRGRGGYPELSRGAPSSLLAGAACAALRPVSSGLWAAVSAGGEQVADGGRVPGRGTEQGACRHQESSAVSWP